MYIQLEAEPRQSDGQGVLDVAVDGGVCKLLQSTSHTVLIVEDDDAQM